MNPECIGNLLALLCTQPVIPGEWPSAKIIHIPPGFIEPAPVDARLAWEHDCKPTLRIGAYGVRKWSYSKEGCEYGP